MVLDISTKFEITLDSLGKLTKPQVRYPIDAEGMIHRIKGIVFEVDEDDEDVGFHLRDSGIVCFSLVYKWAMRVVLDDEEDSCWWLDDDERLVDDEDWVELAFLFDDVVRSVVIFIRFWFTLFWIRPPTA